jgi:prevent-host-death family protein
MDITKDIQPMTTFRNRSAEMLQHLKATRRPMVLTVNGKAAAVVQDAEAYQELLDTAAEASAREGIRQGLQELKAGLGRSAAQVLKEIRADYGIPR